MADDRPVDDPVKQLGKLQRDFDDFRSTMIARLSRRPVGDIEPTIRAVPKSGTLFLQGQVVLRADYPVLWDWANDNGLLMVGLFGPGNGTTTFGLPNFSGRVPIGAGTLGSDTYGLGNLVGAAWRTLTIDQMPAHNHGSAGSHDGHFPADDFVYAAAQDNMLGVPPWNDDGSNAGTHTHQTQGGGDPFDNRQPSLAINWMIWT